MTGNNQEQSGNLPVTILRNEKDALATRLKLEGKNYLAISEATGVPVKTLQNNFAKGGRLEAAYREFLQQSQAQGKEAAAIVLERAKQEAKSAIERIIALSKDANNEAALFKANEYILSLAGMTSETSLRDILQSLTYDQAIERLNPIFVDLYKKPINLTIYDLLKSVNANGPPVNP